MPTEITIPYEPRPVQHRMHELAAQVRHSVHVLHRGAGKTIAGVNMCLQAVLFSETRAPRAAYVGPWRGHTKDTAWDHAKFYAGAIPGAVFNEADLTILFPNRGRVNFYGTDNFHAIRGRHFHCLLIDDFGYMEPDVWGEVLRPTLSVHQGKAIFIGTPAGRNHFYDLFQKADNPPEWGRLHVPASASGVLSAGELASARAAMTAEQFAQEYECDWLTVSGRSIYGVLMDQAHRDGRIGHVPHKPGADVWTSWDLGKRDATAIWAWQRIGPAYHLINFYQASGLTITDCAEVVLKEWGGRQGYRYAIGGHLLPHDADTDVFSAEGTTAEKGRALGLDLTVVERTSVASGINRVRQLLPQCWFDEAKCKEGVEALTHYSYAWNPEMGAFSLNPEHSRWSHAADAFRYYAVGYQDIPTEEEAEAYTKNLKTELAFDPMRYEKQQPGLGFSPWK